jgi:hypothetical protein
MATYTRSELATRVLRDLGLLGADETASAADLDWAEETITSTFAALAGKGIRIWDSSEDAVSETYFVLISHRVGADVAPAFGLMTIADAVTARAALERDLRTLSAQQPTGSVLPADYF